MASSPGAAPLPATVVVRRRARPGCEQLLQNWSASLCQQAQAAPGHVASRVFRRPLQDSGELVLGITFSSPRQLASWNDSPQRARQLAAVDALTEGDAWPLSIHDLTPESWVLGSAPAPGTARPPRWMSALLVWAALYPAVLLIGWSLGPLLDSRHVLLRSFVTTVLLVPFVLFVGVPLLHRALRPVLRRWL